MDWKWWGGKSANEREAQQVLDFIRKDIYNHKNDLTKYQMYKNVYHLNCDQAIKGVQDTITSLQDALDEKLKEYKTEGLNVN